MLKITVENEVGIKTVFNDVLDYAFIDKANVLSIASNIAENVYGQGLTVETTDKLMSEVTETLAELDHLATDDELAEIIDDSLKAIME